MRFAPSFLTLAICLGTLWLPKSVSAQIALDMVDEAVTFEVVDLLVAGKRLSMEWETSKPERGYNGVVVQGFSQLEDFTGSVRFLTEGSTSRWYPLYIVHSVTDAAFLAGYFGDEVHRDAKVEIHFEGDGALRPVLVAAGVFDTERDEDKRDGGTSPPSASKRSHFTSTVEPPVLVTRAEWNASGFRGTPRPLSSSNLTNMTFHHAAGFTATTLEEGKAQVKAIQDFHQNGRGWSDIGYQFVIDRGGNVYQGRPFLDGSTTLEEVPPLSLGAHVGGANTGNIGICLLGCYHPPEGSNCQDQITQVSLDRYVTMFAFLGEAYSIPISSGTLRGHRDFSATSCPGDNNYALLPSIRTEAIQLQQFGSAVPDGFLVEQNAPNPFSGQTTVRYYLLQDGVVDVTVYDLTGKEVAKLVDEFQEGPRWYRTTFDAGSLPSGNYFYQLRVEGFSGEIFRGSRTLVHVK